jgi:hypothetical protein
MMMGVTAEQIAGWGAELSMLTGSLGHLFNRPEPRVVFAQFIEGLLAELPKKNGWTLSERAGHAFIDRRLYLPEEWTMDRARCREAGVPDDVAFATKPELAVAMLEDARTARTPFTWVLDQAQTQSVSQVVQRDVRPDPGVDPVRHGPHCGVSQRMRRAAQGPPHRLVGGWPVAIVSQFAEVERQPREGFRGGRARFLRPTQALGLHVDPPLARAGVADRHTQHLGGPRAAGQEHGEQRPVPVAAKRVEQVLDDVASTLPTRATTKPDTSSSGIAAS